MRLMAPFAARLLAGGATGLTLPSSWASHTRNEKLGSVRRDHWYTTLQEPTLKARIARILALVVTLVVLAGQSLVVGAPIASAAELPQQERRAGPLVVRYVGADDDAAAQTELAWYASAVEQAYRDVQDVFAQALHETQTPLRSEIVVTLYATDAAYAEANPMAGREDGVLGHAQPSEGTIGIAASRLRDKTPGFRRDAIRHELTHVVLGDLSNQRLPIGFQEGIAQYLEHDVDQRQRFAVAVRRGRDAGQLLHFADLNRQRAFLAAAGLAYPESYSVVVFLAQQYGFGNVVKLVTATREAQTLDEAMQQAFGKSMTALEAEWQAFLPGYLDPNGPGWSRNDLDLWTLDQPRALLAEGKYPEARDLFERAEALFASVGRADRQQQALDGRLRATSGVEAIDLTHGGMAALTASEYQTAADLLSQAAARWTTLGDTRRAELTSVAAEQAQDGLVAVSQLDDARRQLEGWHFQTADDLAFAAGQAFAELGDDARTEEARQVMRDAQQLRTQLGLAAAGGGAASVVLLGVALVASRRRRRQPAPAPPGVAVMERDWSL
jgi:hypothetical protein